MAHLPVGALLGASILGMDPAGQAVFSQVFARRASWWNPGAAYVTAMLGYTPANKAGDTFTGNVGVISAPVAGYQLTVGRTGADSASQFKAAAGFNSFLYLCGNGNAPNAGSFDFIQGAANEAYVWNRQNTEIRFGTNNLESARLYANGNFYLMKSGAGFGLKEGGAAARMGVATLVAGTVAVNTTSVTANSRVFCQAISNGGTPGELTAVVTVPGATFTITSTNAADIRSIAWVIFEPS